MPGMLSLAPARTPHTFRTLRARPEQREPVDVAFPRTGVVTTIVGRGAPIFTQDDVGTDVHVIVSGMVKLIRHVPKCGEVIVAVLGPGEMFGELAFIDDGPRESTAKSITDVVLRTYGAADLRSAVAEEPGVAAAMLKQLSARLRRTNDTVVDLTFCDVATRLIKILFELGTRFGRQSISGLHIDAELNQTELAQLVGASRETVNKVLSDFNSKGWLMLEHQQIILLDQDRLARYMR